MSPTFKRRLFLFIGPIVAVLLAFLFSPIAKLAVANPVIGFVLIFSLPIILGAVFIRSETGITTKRAYLGSFVMNFVSMGSLFLLFSILRLFALVNHWFLFTTIFLLLVLSLVRRATAGPTALSRIGIVFVVVNTLWGLIGLYCYGIPSISKLMEILYIYYPAGEVIIIISILIIKALIEIWPAKLFVPQEKLETCVIASNAALLLIITILVASITLIGSAFPEFFLTF